MPTIPLSQGQVARVDWRDYKELSQSKWCAQWHPDVKSYYAVRNVRSAGKQRQRRIRMHRAVLDLPPGRIPEVDHRNHDTLDNRRSNLRVVTQRENSENRRDQSAYGCGVYKLRRCRSRPFQAQVQVQGHRRSIGCYATAEEARQAREEFLKQQE